VCGRDCFTGDDEIECFSCVFEHNPGCLPACGFPAASTQFCSEPNFCPKSGGPGSGSCQEPVTGESPVPVLPTGETPVTMPTVETTGAPGSNGTGGTEAAPIRPNGCTVEWGIDYDGNSISGHRGYAVKDMEQCMDDCAALEQCNVWTYHPRSSSCWLKTSSSGRKAADYAISGAKMCGDGTGTGTGTVASPIRPNGCTVEWGFGYYGGSINGHSSLSVKDWAHCSNLCAALNECLFWLYRKPDSKCWLITSNTERKVNPNGISGTKECGGE